MCVCHGDSAIGDWPMSPPPHSSPELCAIALERLAQPSIAPHAALGLFVPARPRSQAKQQECQAALALQHRISVVSTATGLEQV